MNTSKKNWILVGIVVILLLVLVHVLVMRNSATLTTNQTNTTISSKAYADPGNYYHITVPSNWTITESNATNTTGLKTDNPQSQNIEITQLYIPGQVGVTVQVYESAPTCPFTSQINTTFAGYPASYDPNHHLWIIPTQTATLVVGIAYPGSGGFHGPRQLISPTPVPQSVIEQDQSLLDSIISTFTANHLTPASC